MENSNTSTSKDNKVNNQSIQLSFLKIDKLKRGSHAMNQLLRTSDVIVALNGNIFREIKRY